MNTDIHRLYFFAENYPDVVFGNFFSSSGMMIKIFNLVVFLKDLPITML